MFWFELILIFLLGLAVGSFLNVVIFRWEKGNFLGRSHCPKCGHILKWYELVPVLSFIIQRGKCRKCRMPISWQYPLVELSTGVLFALIFSKFASWPAFIVVFRQFDFYYFGIYLTLLFWFFALSVLICASVFDFREYIIPNKIVFWGAIISFFHAIAVNFFANTVYFLYPKNGFNFLYPYAEIFNRLSGSIFYYLIGAVLASGFLWIIYLLTRGKGIGFGDVKFGIFLGLAFGWPDILMVLILAFIIGAVWGLLLVIMGRKKMKGMLPFGPFLSFGAILTILIGGMIIKWYFGMWGL